MVAFCSPGDCDKSFIAVVLRLIDFDNTTAEVTDLVDLGSSFTDDGTDHVVRDVDLLSDRLSRH